MEYVYQLRLPSLENVLKNNIIEKVDNSKAHILTIEPLNFFNDNILSLKGLTWDSGVAFKKPGLYTGPIHTDGSQREFIWGINWIHGADGGMCYWEGDYQQDITYDIAGRPRLDPIGKLGLNPPSKNYKTLSGNAYLVNASVPHNAYNLSLTHSRYAISIRATNSQLNWQQVVDLFSDLII